MKRKFSLLTLVFVLAGLLFLGQLVVSHRLAVIGEQSYWLNQEITVLSNQNQLLAQKIIEQSCLSQISLKAGRMGMVKATAIAFNR